MCVPCEVLSPHPECPLDISSTENAWIATLLYLKYYMPTDYLPLGQFSRELGLVSSDFQRWPQKGFLRLRLFPPTSQKKKPPSSWIRPLAWMCLYKYPMINCHPIQGVFPALTQYSRDTLSIDQDKVHTEDEWTTRLLFILQLLKLWNLVIPRGSHSPSSSFDFLFWRTHWPSIFHSSSYLSGPVWDIFSGE